MSSFHRRHVLTGAVVIAARLSAALVGARRAEAGDPSFMNNVPDPLLADKEVPPFKFAPKRSASKAPGKSFGKEATVEQPPISKGIAGVSMKLEPGTMRELHWHGTEAAWAFVLEGRVRATAIDPQEFAETNEFEPGDVWLFPHGHGHTLECLGNEPCHLILIFDGGYFSESGTFSISGWIDHTPRQYVIQGNISVTMFGSHGRYRTETLKKGAGNIPPRAGVVAEDGRNLPDGTQL